MADKRIIISAHALEQARRRGAAPSEIEDAIRTTPWTIAAQGRSECRKNFPFNTDWNGKRYATKQVRPIFIEETNGIVVITVYVFYF